MSEDKPWKVEFSKKVIKQLKRLPHKAQHMVVSLKVDIEHYGPIRTDWSNFSALDKKSSIYHCHLNKRGHPTYIAIWQVIDKKIRFIEITNVGTREDAPY